MLEGGGPGSGAVEDDIRKGEYDRAAVEAGIEMIRMLYQQNSGNLYDDGICSDISSYVRPAS